MKLKLKKWNRVWDEDGEYEDVWEDFGEHNVMFTDKSSDNTPVTVDGVVYSNLYAIRLGEDYVEFQCFSQNTDTSSAAKYVHHHFRGYA